MTDSLTPTDFDFISRPEVKEEEKIWCKIGADGDLELFDWEYVDKLAREYDLLSTATKKSNAHIICKLAVLIREQTLHKASEALLKYADVSAEATTIIIKDPLEEV
jgi:hypothetical protein